jgi:hypothetical protein
MTMPTQPSKPQLSAARWPSTARVPGGGGLGAPGHAGPDRTVGLLGVRAELAWLGRAEQTCQDAGDEIWVAAREFLGAR